MENFSASFMSATAAAAAHSTLSSYPLPDSLLPPNHNPALKTPLGDAALYNPTLILMSYALFQHTLVFGLLALLRNFNFPRLLDLHFLALGFAATFVVAPLVFLVNPHLDAVKLFFFLEHIAVEFLIAIRIFFQPLCREHPGKVILACWFAISALSIVVACNYESGFYHAADVVAWTAFASDFSVGVAGARLAYRWLLKRRTRRSNWASGYKLSIREHHRRKKDQAEAMAGMGFMLHGFTTTSVGPTFARVLYDNAPTDQFAYAWVAVFATAFFAVGLCSPCISIWLGTINWCCAHNRKVLPGQANYEDSDDDGTMHIAAHAGHTHDPPKWSPSTTTTYEQSVSNEDGLESSSRREP